MVGSGGSSVSLRRMAWKLDSASISPSVKCAGVTSVKSTPMRHACTPHAPSLSNTHAAESIQDTGILYSTEGLPLIKVYPAVDVPGCVAGDW